MPVSVQIDPLTGERIQANALSPQIDPQTGERATSAPQQTPQMSAQPRSQHPVQAWLHDLDTDVTQGGNRTAPGRLLGRMQGRGDEGYTGMNSGGSAPVAQFMGSPILGPVHTAQGVAETPQHPIMGPVHAAEGVMQTAAIPSAMMGGEGAEAGINAIPSKKYAGKMLNSVLEDAKDVPVALKSALPHLERVQQLSDAGAPPVGVADKLYNRLNTINPLTFGEARDFSSNIANPSTYERLAMNPTMQSTMGKLKTGLNSDMTDAAGIVGRGEDYAKALKEYAQASKLHDVAGKAGSYLIKGLASTAGLGGAYEGYKLLKGQ